MRSRSLAVADTRPDLHQLVVAQRAVQFRHDVRAEAALADQDDGIAGVAEPAEMLALCVGEAIGRVGKRMTAAVV